MTFRLADSIPRSVGLAWEAERRIWLAAHGVGAGLGASEFATKYAAIAERERRAFERRFAHRLHAELDRGHGECLLSRPKIRAALADALHHFDGARCRCGDWVIMPNHVHWLVAPQRGWKLEGLLSSIKGFVSVQATRLGAKAGRLWQSESHDHLVRNRAELAAFRKYIAENPGKARLAAGRFAVWQAEWDVEG